MTLKEGHDIKSRSPTLGLMNSENSVYVFLSVQQKENMVNRLASHVV